MNRRGFLGALAALVVLRRIPPAAPAPFVPIEDVRRRYFPDAPGVFNWDDSVGSIWRDGRPEGKDAYIAVMSWPDPRPYVRITGLERT